MRPAIKTGSDIGNIFIKNSTNDQSATLAIKRFWGSPTVVETPPNAVPTAPCIRRFLRKLLKVVKSSDSSENSSSFSATFLYTW